MLYLVVGYITAWLSSPAAAAAQVIELILKLIVHRCSQWGRSYC